MLVMGGKGKKKRGKTSDTKLHWSVGGGRRDKVHKRSSRLRYRRASLRRRSVSRRVQSLETVVGSQSSSIAMSRVAALGVSDYPPSVRCCKILIFKFFLYYYSTTPQFLFSIRGPHRMPPAGL
jgi:hypothetical protein